MDLVMLKHNIWVKISKVPNFLIPIFPIRSEIKKQCTSIINHIIYRSQLLDLLILFFYFRCCRHRIFSKSELEIKTRGISGSIVPTIYPLYKHDILFFLHIYYLYQFSPILNSSLVIIIF